MKKILSLRQMPFKLVRLLPFFPHIIIKFPPIFLKSYVNAGAFVEGMKKRNPDSRFEFKSKIKIVVQQPEENVSSLFQ